MKKKSIKKTKKTKPKRNKKYSGAKAQSLKDAESTYQPAIDFVGNFSSKIAKIQDTFDLINKPLYSSSVFGAISGLQKQMSAFKNLNDIDLTQTSDMGSLGIGLSLLFKNGASFFVRCEPSVKTEVSILFKRATNYKELREQLQFITLQIYD